MTRAIAIELDDARLVRDLLTDEFMDGCTVAQKAQLLRLKYNLWAEVEKADKRAMVWEMRKKGVCV